METIKTPRGFILVNHDTYPDWGQNRLLQESGMIGEYEDSFENPGSSFLWVGEFRLNREEVRELTEKLEHWLENKRLPFEEDEDE